MVGESVTPVAVRTPVGLDVGDMVALDAGEVVEVHAALEWNLVQSELRSARKLVNPWGLSSVRSSGLTLGKL